MSVCVCACVVCVCMRVCVVCLCVRVGGVTGVGWCGWGEESVCVVLWVVEVCGGGVCGVCVGVCVCECE